MSIESFMLENIFTILLINYSILITFIIVFLARQLKLNYKKNKQDFFSKHNLIEQYLKLHVDETSKQIDINGELNIKDFLCKNITKRHILTLRNTFFVAELEAVKQSISNDKLYVNNTPYYSLVKKVQAETKNLLNKNKADYLSYFKKQTDLVEQQQHYYGKSDISEFNINDPTIANLLSLREELIKIEISGLKRNLEPNNFYHKLYKNYSNLLKKIMSSQSDSVNLEKIKDGYINKTIAQYDKDIKSYQEKIADLEELKRSYESTINDLQNRKGKVSSENNLDDDSNEIVESLTNLLKSSNGKILALEDEIQKYEVMISEIEAKNSRVNKDNSQALSADAIEEHKMVHEFFQDITELTKKINILEKDKVSLQQQIRQKNRIIKNLKTSDYKQAYEAAINKIKMVNHSYQELEEMYISLLKRHQSSNIKQAS